MALFDKGADATSNRKGVDRSKPKTRPSQEIATMPTKQKKTSAVEKKLIGIADIVVTAAERSKDPTFAIPIRALSNVSFNATQGHDRDG